MDWATAVSPHGHALTAFDGSFLTVDSRFSEIVQRDITLLRTLTILGVTHIEDRTPNHIKLDRLRLGDEPFEITKRYIREDGSSALVRNHVSRFKDRLGPDRLIASVELIPEVAPSADETVLFGLAATLQRDQSLRPQWPVKGEWKNQAWSRDARSLYSRARGRIHPF